MVGLKSNCVSSLNEHAGPDVSLGSQRVGISDI